MVSICDDRTIHKLLWSQCLSHSFSRHLSHRDRTISYRLDSGSRLCNARRLSYQNGCSLRIGHNEAALPLDLIVRASWGQDSLLLQGSQWPPISFLNWRMTIFSAKTSWDEWWGTRDTWTLPSSLRRSGDAYTLDSTTYHSLLRSPPSWTNSGNRI